MMHVGPPPVKSAPFRTVGQSGHGICRPVIPLQRRFGWRAVRTIVVGAGLLLVIVFFAFQLRPSDTGATRLFAIVDVVTQGPQADPNLRGRIEFWQSSLNYLDKQPFGTL